MTNPHLGKHSYYCCDLCGQSCPLEQTETQTDQTSKELTILQKLHSQNNDLIEHIRYLSKRNEQLNTAIESRLKTEESSVKKQNLRSKSGIIYRSHQPCYHYQAIEKEGEPRTVTYSTFQRSDNRTNNELKNHSAFRIIKPNHLDTPSHLQKSFNKDQTTKKRSIFALAEASSKKNQSLSPYSRKQEHICQSRTLTKQPSKLNYIPIEQQCQQQSRYQRIEASKVASNYVPKPPEHFEVTFRTSPDQKRKKVTPQYVYEQEKLQKRTNHPYLAMLNQSSLHPSIYYPNPAFSSKPDRIDIPIQPNPLQYEYRRRLYPAYY